MEGKKLLQNFLEIAPLLPKILGMEDNVIIWATDKKKYIYMDYPNSEEWESFNTKVGDDIRAGVGPVVLKTKKPYHAVIPAEVFGKCIRAAAYPVIEDDEILGVVGISFGLEFETEISKIASELSKMCAQLKYK